MGAISFNLDRSLVAELQTHLPLKLFVETGTFRGESLAAVRDLFDRCITIELSPEYHAAAVQRFAEDPQVTVLLGDSPVVLAAQRAAFSGHSTLFWLDAHWCAAEDTAGEKSQCPLLQEIAAIGHLDAHSAILIDDARLFLGPPPKPHEISAWPTLDAVAGQLRQLSAAHTLVHYNDVLLFIPAGILPALRPFLQEHISNLLTLADKARDYDAILSQAKAKDREITEKEAEIASKEREMRLLRTVAEERLEAIHKLDTGLTETRRILSELRPDPAGASALPVLVDEVSALRFQLSGARTQLQTLQARLKKLELAEIARTSGRGRPTFWRRVITAWLEKLAAASPTPLAKLQQHEPRPLRRESFPRPRAREKWPRICIATPSYQQAPFLERTMRSVLDQNYPNLAYGVQDGGSTDGSVDTILKYVPRLAHAESAPDKGQADAIRRGFAKLYPASRDIMGWLNSDDMLMPGALHYVGDYFSRHPEVDVIYGHRVVIDEQDREVGRWYLPRYHANTLRWFDLVPQETLFWRASCFQDVGGIDPSFHFAMDWDLLLRFEERGYIIHRVPYFLGCFRVHEQQKTSAKIVTVGEQEMKRLRERTHERPVQNWEVQSQLTAEIQRSAAVAWLHRYGVRY